MFESPNNDKFITENTPRVILPEVAAPTNTRFVPRVGFVIKSWYPPTLGLRGQKIIQD